MQYAQRARDTQLSTARILTSKHSAANPHPANNGVEIHFSESHLRMLMLTIPVLEEPQRLKSLLKILRLELKGKA